MTSFPSRITPEALEKLFSDAAYQFDLAEGTIAGLSERVIYLTEDLILGIYQALTDEAGEAWGIILKSSGYLWGQRLALVLEKKTRAQFNRELGELAVEDYLALLEAYFAQHGWGRLKLWLDDAEPYGIVRASLGHSLFAASLRRDGEPVDFLVAGMLRALFERISNQPLDCLQVTWAGTGEFLISAPDRIEAIASLVPEFRTVEDALARLRGA
ncbi:hypothetical protein [Methylomagnum sp.]